MFCDCQAKKNSKAKGLLLNETFRSQCTQPLIRPAYTSFQGKAPQIRKKLVGLSADENDRIELTAIVDGLPLPTALWFQNGNPLQNAPPERKICSTDNKYCLVIEKVKVEMFSLLVLKMPLFFLTLRNQLLSRWKCIMTLVGPNAVPRWR